MVKSFKYFWQLPQNLLGLIVKKITKATEYTKYKDATVYSWTLWGGLSLGKYIFVPFANTTPLSGGVMRYIKHEYGHSIQSKYLGWFYLLVIGLPSLIWCKCFEVYRIRTGKDYYDFYTESWANKLGGVNNDQR